MAKSKCFIIMPVTTPADVAGKYNGDRDHFEHVLDCLFVPAVEKAELEPVMPIAKGSDLIHGRIIKNLENTDVVLCDMSILNPNVFFELGVRTALNKPVCMVMDDCTPKIPFDLGVINCHEYSGAINQWEINDQIDKLSDHLTASVKGSDGKNTLWQVFGMSSTGEPFEPKGGVEGKLEALTMQIEAMRTERSRQARVGPESELSLQENEAISDVICSEVRGYFLTLNDIPEIPEITIQQNLIQVSLNKMPSTKIMLNLVETLRYQYHNTGLKICFAHEGSGRKHTWTL